ncbi:endosome-associated-trafficking regulator 1 [Euwallacea fornicatus]|uniref:endosome-associated-trafficking regulator 1 n=1 Tax=Euwallacea fornicatus TaxID=995702 RepID=UPI00338EF4CC
MSGENSPPKEENVEPDNERNPRPPARSLALDLGDDNAYNMEANRLGLGHSTAAAPEVQESTSNSSSKREDNPFSFKHFLRDNTNSNQHYRSLGARPKVYRHVTPPDSPRRPNNRTVGEFSSALPDFVQDHLVIEQSFLGNKFDVPPDFNLDLPDYNQWDQQGCNKQHVSRSNSIDDQTPGGPIPLDLPGLSMGNAFPLDLPLSANISNSESHITAPLTEVGNSKSLPDFLTDGPVRNTTEVAVPSPTTTEPIRDISRCQHCAKLNAELISLRQRLSRTDDEVDRNYRRASVAENTIGRLKQELKSLKSQLKQLQAENEVLQEGYGAAVGGAGEPPLELQAQRLGQELRAAASTAEHSLRSLLTGVDNLRIMASTLENLHRIEEKSTDRFSRFDDDSVGPAL